MLPGIALSHLGNEGEKKMKRRKETLHAFLNLSI